MPGTGSLSLILVMSLQQALKFIINVGNGSLSLMLVMSLQQALKFMASVSKVSPANKK